MAERLFSTYQLADLLGTSSSEVVRWIEQGLLPFKRLPSGPLRVSESGLVSFLKNQGIDLGEIMGKMFSEPPGSPAVSVPEPEEILEPVLSQEYRREKSPALLPELATMAEYSAPEASEQAEEEIMKEATVQIEIEAAAAPVVDGHEEEDVSQTPEPSVEPEVREGTPSEQAEQILEAIFRDIRAARTQALHWDMTPDGLDLKVRIDGVVYPKPNFRQRLPKGVGTHLVALLKELAGLDTYNSRLQTGRLTHELEGEALAMTLTVAPTRQGEKLVLSLLTTTPVPQGLAALGVDAAAAQELRECLYRSRGLILLAGAEIQDRAMVAASLLGELDPSRDCVLADHPYAHSSEGVSCVRASDEGRMVTAETFEMLERLDPDVIVAENLVGNDTIRLAVKATEKGRLVIASLPAHDMTESLEILLNSEHRWLLASSLLAVAGVQSMRKICPHCRQAVEPDPKALAKLGLTVNKVGEMVYRGKGCEDCARTGYSGRTYQVSVLRVDHTVAEWIRKGNKAEEIMWDALSDGMKTTQDIQLQKLRAGLVSLEELLRHIPPQE
jgi:type II secretory ATPase GspE/PulE/Tfp pilus assembly ATPase PilB-like protein